jgi:hypothetical protein
MYYLPDHEGKSLLHYASERGNIPLIEYLCSFSNPGINLSDSTGRMPRHYAVRSRRVQAIDLLVAKGADLGSVGAIGRTTLNEAVIKDNVGANAHLCTLLGDRVALMLESTDQEGMTPLTLAKKRKKMAALEYLKLQCPGDAEEKYVTQNGDDGRCPGCDIASQCTCLDTTSWRFCGQLCLRGLVGIGLLSLLYVSGAGLLPLATMPYSARSSLDARGSSLR